MKNDCSRPISHLARSAFIHFSFLISHLAQSALSSYPALGIQLLNLLAQLELQNVVLTDAA